MGQVFNKLKETLTKSQKVVIISHNRPDGDTVGSNLALRLYLESEGKSVTSACADEIPENFNFLPDIEKFTSEFLLEDYDMVIIVDAGAKHLVRFFTEYPELNRTKKPIICIDHHSSNDKFGTVNVIEPTETSTTQLIYKFFKDQNIKITPPIATCLLNGIYTDTGSFMHSNTTTETMKISSELIKLGADFKNIAKFNFKSISSKKLKLMGEVLGDTQVDETGRVISGVKNETFQKYDANSEDLTGVVDFLNSIPKAKYTVLYTEDDKGNVKASLRTQHDDVNVAKIAEEYGGGGHPKAAGYRVPGKLQKQTCWKIEKD